MRHPVILGIVSYQVFPARMGGQKGIAGFYRQLGSQLKVVLAAAKENTETTGQGFTVLPFLYNHWKGILNIVHIGRLKKIIAQHHVNLICVEHSYFGWIGIWLRKITRHPFVIHSHNIEAHRFRDMQRSWWRLYGYYEKWVHRKANHSFFKTEEDRQWAIQHWDIEPSRCSVLSYGATPHPVRSHEERKLLRRQLLVQYGIQEQTRLFVFNGSLDYPPNTDALRIIINEIIPILDQAGFNYKLFISGKGLDTEWTEVLKKYPHIIYTGFVEDINLYLDGADCFINPVTLGSGICTKIVDALSHNQAVISTHTGARGVDAGSAGQKLMIVNDYAWKAFAGLMMQPALPVYEPVPDAFREAFNWDRIVQKAIVSLQNL